MVEGVLFKILDGFDDEPIEYRNGRLLSQLNAGSFSLQQSTHRGPELSLSLHVISPQRTEITIPYKSGVGTDPPFAPTPPL